MRHRVAGKHLGRTTAHRMALFRNLMTELFRHERIRTTHAKAQAIRSEAEHLVTIAKHGRAKANGDGHDVHERRQVAAVLRDPMVVRKLFDEIAPRFQERPGGYTRMIKVGRRQGDGAEMVVLELVD
jgi:large subunit ribosomal protein L17